MRTPATTADDDPSRRREHQRLLPPPPLRRLARPLSGPFAMAAQPAPPTSGCYMRLSPEEYKRALHVFYSHTDHQRMVSSCGLHRPAALLPPPPIHQSNLPLQL